MGRALSLFWNTVIPGSKDMSAHHSVAGAARKAHQFYGESFQLSISKHAQSGLPIAVAQLQEQRSCPFDFLVGTVIGGGLQGHGGRVIGAADEGQCLRQAPHCCAVNYWFGHWVSGISDGSSRGIAEERFISDYR